MKIDSATRTPTQPDHEAKRLHEVAGQFESLLLKQLLDHAKLTTGEGYGAMATDALAEGLTKAGGIGLAETIERSLSSTMSHKTIKGP